MPFEISDQAICENCPYGCCVLYIREQSKRMKDRDTLYRIAQKTGMQCAFSDGIPGFAADLDPDQPLTFFVERVVENAKAAGVHLEKMTPSYFGEVQAPFQITQQQVGKVRGDVYEVIASSILWNCAAYLNQDASQRTDPGWTAIPDVLKNAEAPHKIAIVGLGDNYDLKKLLDPQSREQLSDFEGELMVRDTSACYSTPDLVCVSIDELGQDTIDHFSLRLPNLSDASQAMLSESRKQLEGRVPASALLFAVGLKTSIRSDRMYQFLFEANAWKFLWRKAFKVEPSRYYSVLSRSYGANPEKLRSVEFASIDENFANAQPAIDAMVHVASPAELIEWFASLFSAGAA